MSEKPTDTTNTKESKVSRWILVGGVLVLVVSVCLLFAGAFIAHQDRGYETQSQNGKDSEDSLSAVASEDHAHESDTSPTNNSLTGSSNSVDRPIASADNAAKDSKPSKSLLSDPSVMWEHIDEEAVDESEVPDFPREITNRALVRMNSSVWTTTEGHRVQFPIPQRNLILEGEVTGIGGTPLAPTLKGRVTDEGKSFPFTLTFSDKSAFATVSTTTGNYELFANRDYGWVMSAEEMKEHIDYSVPHSFIENPDPHAGHDHAPP